MRRKRRGFTLIELLVVIAIIGLLVALLFPALQMVLERSRFIQCSGNLKQFGIAMKAYTGTHGMLPPGVMIRTSPIENWADALDLDFGFRGNAVSSLLGYFEAKGVQDLYNTELDWYDQPLTVAQTRIDLFICPSSAQETLSEPVILQIANEISSNNQVQLVNFAPCNYIVSKGVSDAWCLPMIRELTLRFNPQGYAQLLNILAPNAQTPGDERGAFEINSSARMEDIRDGEQNTILMGECAVGPTWKICSDGNTSPPPGFPSGNSVCGLQGSFVSPSNPQAFPDQVAVPVRNSGTQRAVVVKWAWLPSFVMPNTWEASPGGASGSIAFVSNFGCTIWPINMNPVPSSWVNLDPSNVTVDSVLQLADCRSAYVPQGQAGGDISLGHRRTLDPARRGRVSGFHSDHPGGANFLFADSHVEFLNESIDIAVYRGLSSIAGGDNAQK